MFWKNYASLEIRIEVFEELIISRFDRKEMVYSLYIIFPSYHKVIK